MVGEEGQVKKDNPGSQLCGSDCREDLLGRIEQMLPKSIIWKVVSLLFLFWALASSIYLVGLNERKAAISTNTAIAIANREQIAVMTNDWEYVKNSQNETMSKLDELLRYTRQRQP